jgi:hypothetical protein
MGQASTALQLRCLDFLVGESSGPGVIYPPGKQALPFTGYMNAQWESCDRFLKMEFFGHLHNGFESVQSMITYSEKLDCFRMWCFTSGHEEPILMQGDFKEQSLVFMSDPTDMSHGIEKMRCSLTPVSNGLVDYKVEFWTIDGYVPYFEARLAGSDAGL